MYTFITVESALSMAPMFPLLAAEFKLNDTQVSLLTGVCVLGLGYANFVIVPCSNIFGRRFTSILFGALVVGSSSWEASAKSYTSLMAARVINGVATATNESIMVQVVADVFFLHERGLWMGVYLQVSRSLFLRCTDNEKHVLLSRPFHRSSHLREYRTKVGIFCC